MMDRINRFAGGALFGLALLGVSTVIALAMAWGLMFGHAAATCALSAIAFVVVMGLAAAVG